MPAMATGGIASIIGASIPAIDSGGIACIVPASKACATAGGTSAIAAPNASAGGAPFVFNGNVPSEFNRREVNFGTGDAFNSQWPQDEPVCQVGFQTNGQFVWKWAREHPALMALIFCFPISYSFIYGTKFIVEHFEGIFKINGRSFTKTQLKIFSEIVDVFSPTHPKTTFHVLNTSGVLHFPEAQYNMVRTGISLYGYGNNPSVDAQLKPVLTLKTVISQIHSLEEGDTLGYNRAFTANSQTKTATLPLGHADGIGRIYGNGKGYVMIKGQQASVLGNVCMDMIMVNVTDIDCQVGDTVIVIGPNASAENLANSAGTISYEFITGLSQRIKRKIIS